MVKLSSSGEVGQFTSVTQFDGGSTGKCGFFAAATAVGSAVSGEQPWTPDTIASSAAQHYVQFDGSDTTDNLLGMTQAMLHDDLATYGVSGKDINPDWNTIKASLKAGYPVIICVPEIQIVDKAVGGGPYPWDSTGINHVILLTGIAPDGNVLVRDSANITAPNSIRSGPRTYIIANMSPFWATAVTPKWYSATQGGTNVGIPIGWKDNNNTLTAPNGIQIKDVFRAYILTHPWDSGNIPLEAAHGLNPLELSNTSLGAGTRQSFRWIVLEWTSKGGVFESWVGAELIATLTLLHDIQDKYKTLGDAWNKVVPEKNGLLAANTTLNATVSHLNAEIEQLKAAPGGNTEQQQRIDALTTQVTGMINKLTQIDVILKAS